MNAEARRSRLFLAVEIGRLNPVQAEKLAARRNLPSLMPAPPVIDVSALLSWTLPMAAAWLIWRDFKKVARYAPDRGKTAYFWRSVPTSRSGNGRSGFVLEAARQGAPDLRDLHLAEGFSEANGEPMFMSHEDALDCLWHFLGDGSLLALGYNRDGDLTNIESHFWGELVEHVSLGHHDALCFRGSSNRVAFRQVTVVRTEFMSAAAARHTNSSGDGPHSDIIPQRSGAPGRPSSMHVVEVELERRIRERIPFLSSSVQGRAAELHEWFAKSHAEGPPLTAKTIKNKLSSKLRAA